MCQQSSVSSEFHNVGEPICGAKLIFMPRVHGLCHITPLFSLETVSTRGNRTCDILLHPPVGELSREEGTHTAVYVKVLFPERDFMCMRIYACTHTHIYIYPWQAYSLVCGSHCISFQFQA